MVVHAQSPPLEAVDLQPPGPLPCASVYEAFATRRTVRDISPAPIGPALLANLLWAACGVNRTQGPFGAAGRTAPSASNSQEIEVFVALEHGAFRYDAPAHRLDPVVRGDLRALAMNHRQGLMSKAPVQLVYVFDIDRLTHTIGFDEPGLHDPGTQSAYAHVDTGLIAANVHLFAAAHGLAAWFHNCERQALASALRLGPDQHVLYAQSVGWPE